MVYNHPKREYLKAGKAAAEAVEARLRPDVVVGRTMEEYEKMSYEEERKAICLVRLGEEPLRIKLFVSPEQIEARLDPEKIPDVGI